MRKIIAIRLMEPARGGNRTLEKGTFEYAYREIGSGRVPGIEQFLGKETLFIPMSNINHIREESQIVEAQRVFDATKSPAERVAEKK